MSKQLVFDSDARAKILSGIRQLARAVKSTLGPAGQHVLIEKPFGPPVITKDGVSVASEIDLKDKFENMGAKLVREVASKTSDEAGDGTTTATVLAEAIYSQGLKALAAGLGPIPLKCGIELAVKACIKAVQESSIEISGKDDIAKVAAISANNDGFIGKLLADAFEKVGKDGVITTEEGRSIDTELELVEGMQFDRGYTSPNFINRPETADCTLQGPIVLVHEKPISNVHDLVPMLGAVSTAGSPFVIIAEDFSNEVLATLVLNKLRGAINVCAVKAPGFGDARKEMLTDIAALVGATLISPDAGTKLNEENDQPNMKYTGNADRAIITKDMTTLVVSGTTEVIKERVTLIRGQIAAAQSGFAKDKLEERLAKLVGGVAKITVGGATESEIKEKMARVEDALNATRAAIDEGVVPGGGVSLVRARDRVIELIATSDATEHEGEFRGMHIILNTLELPLKTIAKNAGARGDVVVSRVIDEEDVSSNFGYNALTNKYEDMMEAGIIDPAKVVCVALRNAASIAGLLLTTNAVITDEPPKDAPPMPMPPPGGFPGPMM
jgi:chaperonin GroEL